MNAVTFARLEAWALNVVERVKAGGTVEDTRVELKAAWIDAKKAARRLAGHANASRGSDLLWIIGLDEADGVVGAPPSELASWWSQVKALFDGVAPAMTDLTLSVDGKELTALFFSTSRAPYVVRNPEFGIGHGPISREVPWREGTQTRSATRFDLLQILVPVAALPEVEFLEGWAWLDDAALHNHPSELSARLTLELRLYLVPHAERTVVPYHRCSCRVAPVNDVSQWVDGEVSLGIPAIFSASRSILDTASMERTSAELIARGPGKVTVTSTTVFSYKEPDWLVQGASLCATLSLFVVDASVPITLTLAAHPASTVSEMRARWIMKADSNAVDGDGSRAS